MDIESLDEAIADFNDWNGAARIYYDTQEEYFSASVYSNDVQMTQTFSEDNFITAFSKRETDNISIGKKRKEYILDYVRLVLEGYSPNQADFEINNS